MNELAQCHYSDNRGVENEERMETAKELLENQGGIVVMDDLISRQAALDIVFDFAETPDKMYQQIRELPGIGWIPCSERLPDKAGQYLTTCSKWGAWKVDWNIWVTEQNPLWLWEHGVIAWMPMPEPYKEEEDV